MEEVIHLLYKANKDGHVYTKYLCGREWKFGDPLHSFYFVETVVKKPRLLKKPKMCGSCVLVHVYG